MAETRRRTWVSDAVTAGLAGATMWFLTGYFEYRYPVWAFAITLLFTLALVWRRRYPFYSTVAVYLVALLHLKFGPPVILPTDLLVAWSLRSVTVYGPVWASNLALAGAGVGTVFVSWGQSTGATVLTAAAFTIAWVTGWVQKTYQLTADTRADREQRLEIERAQQTRLAAAAERARISREMHDIVAHSLSVMIAQADGGRYAAPNDPAAAALALDTIAETGRATLTDMRRLLGVLRTDPEPLTTAPNPLPGRRGWFGRPTKAAPAVHLPQMSPSPSPTGPLPAVNDIGSLVAQMRTSGMRVSLVRIGKSRHLPPGTGLTLYRIAQESLTNVLKHAGPNPEVTVVLHWLPSSVVLEITDDGRGAAADSASSGHGLLGMRERAAMFAGEVSAGPRPGGGFRVRASLPTPDLKPETNHE